MTAQNGKQTSLSPADIDCRQPFLNALKTLNPDNR